MARYQAETQSLSGGTMAFVAVVGAFFAAFLIYPVLYVFKSAFWVNGELSLHYFRIILFENPVYRQCIVNSLALAAAATLMTTILAVPLAFLSVRYRFRGKGILAGLLLVPMIMPPFVGAIGMRRLLARGGSVNLILQKLGVTETGVDFLGAGGFWAVVVLEALHLYPIMYLNVAAALANVDPSLEEAAQNLGDSGLRLFRKVTFPLMLPGYFAGAVLVFIWAFTDLGTPLIFNYDRVVAVQIFNMIRDINANPMAYALVVVVILLTAAIFLAGRSYVGRRGYEMLSKGVAARRETPLHGLVVPLIWVGLLGLVAFALLPHISVVLTSVSGKWSDTVLPTDWTLKYYARAARHELAVTGVRNSLFLAGCSTLLDIVIGVGIAFILVRRRFHGVEVLDAMAMMPLALPGIVLAFGYVVCFRGTVLDPNPIHGGGSPFPLLIIAYAVRRLPYMVRAAVAGFQQTSVSLDEAAMNLGASPVRALFRITVPLILANLIAGAILVFSFAMLEVSDSLILAVRQEHYPLTKAIYQLHTRITDGDFLASAMGIMAMFLLAGTLLATSALLGKKMGQLFRVS